MSRTAISANKVVVGLPRHRPWGAAPSLDPANVGTASEPTVKIGPCPSAATATSGTLTRRWQRCPEPASPPGTLACGTMPDGRRHTRTGRPPSHATPKGNPPSETRHPTALRTPAATSTRHNPEGYGEGTRLSRSLRRPRGGWGRRTLVPRPSPQAQAPRFQPPITTAPACPWGVTEAERKEAPASSPATAARIGHSGSGVV